ncbi:hypothetical protein ABMA46_08155 [Mesorhizobium sp. CN5-321]
MAEKPLNFPQGHTTLPKLHGHRVTKAVGRDFVIKPSVSHHGLETLMNAINWLSVPEHEPGHGTHLDERK